MSVRTLLSCLVIAAAMSSAGCSEGIKVFMESAARAMAPDQPLRVSITRFGVVEVEPDGDYEAAPTTTTGRVRPMALSGFVTDSNRIPATLGTSWGIEYVVAGGDDSNWVALEMHTIHPPLRNPETGNLTTVSRWVQEAPKGEGWHRFYTLEYDWEVVPGDWSFEIYHDGVLLAKQDFVLYDPGE